MWVNGHTGIKGNEEAGRAAKLRGAYGGRVTGPGRADRVTPAGIRQEFPIHTKPKHLQWSRKALRELVYVTTDRGPQKRWLKIIGRSEDDLCGCGEIQNVVHLRRCKLVGDGKGRQVEECQKDMEWCKAVADFLSY